MKRAALSVIFVIMTIASLHAQNNKIYTVKTNSENVRIIVNGSESEESIPFNANRSDTIQLSINVDPLCLEIQTDIDSLKLLIPVDLKYVFNIRKETMQPFVLIINHGLEIDSISFDKAEQDFKFKFAYEKGTDNPYLQKLRAKYPIDSIAAIGKTDIEKVRHIASWVHNLWQHDGMNEPKQSDALYILDQVRQGQRFRCVEYGIVTTACLNAIGLPSRTLSLKTKNVETTPSGAGHVVMEVFLKDLNKWVMVDPQWDAIPYLENTPLNAVEFQEAITQKKNIDIKSSDIEFNKFQYEAWIYPYLYYFSCKFDNRENIPKEARITINGKTDLMLVPLGAKEPTVFQRRFSINYCIYTNSLSDFYSNPY